MKTLKILFVLPLLATLSSCKENRDFIGETVVDEKLLEGLNNFECFYDNPLPGTKQNWRTLFTGINYYQNFDDIYELNDGKEYKTLRIEFNLYNHIYYVLYVPENVKKKAMEVIESNVDYEFAYYLQPDYRPANYVEGSIFKAVKKLGLLGKCTWYKMLENNLQTLQKDVENIGIILDFRKIIKAYDVADNNKNILKGPITAFHRAIFNKRTLEVVDNLEKPYLTMDAIKQEKEMFDCELEYLITCDTDNNLDCDYVSYPSLFVEDHIPALLKKSMWEEGYYLNEEQINFLSENYAETFAKYNYDLETGFISENEIYSFIQEIYK